MPCSSVGYPKRKSFQLQGLSPWPPTRGYLPLDPDGGPEHSPSSKFATTPLLMTNRMSHRLCAFDWPWMTYTCYKFQFSQNFAHLEPTTARWMKIDPHCHLRNCSPLNVYFSAVYTVWVNPSPCSFLIFSPNGWEFLISFFTHLLYVTTYVRLQIFIHLSPTLTKLCHRLLSETAHRIFFYISLELNF